jgi:glutathione synthase/RimK-type ligase-like ATP-grasp enzyme
MSVLIAIHNRSGSFSDRWIEYCQQHGIKHIIVNCHNTDIIDQLRKADALLWSWHLCEPADQLVARQLISVVELTGVRTFPNALTSWHYDDKIAQKYLLEAVDAPLVPSYVFFHKEDALGWISQATFPKVFKLRCGAGSDNVRLVRNRRAAIQLCHKMFGKGLPSSSANYFRDFRRKVRQTKGWGHFFEKLKRMPAVVREIFYQWKHLPRQLNYMYFQDYLPNNTHDTRVAVIGNRAFAFIRMNRPGDFRASGSGRLVYESSKIDIRCVRIALDVSKKIDVQSMAYDFIFDEHGEPKIVEISYTYMAKAVYDCAGYWDPDLLWHEGHYWPQDLILTDLLDALSPKSINTEAGNE